MTTTPYSAEFGAIIHEEAPCESLVRAALHDADEVSGRIHAGGYRANLSDVELLRNHVRKLSAALRNRMSEPEARMWPESDGETPRCNGCGCSSRYWHGENRLWNLVMGGPSATDDPGGIMCPNCFIDRAAASARDDR